MFVCSCVVFLDWSVEVSSEGRVTPKIDLLTKIPERGELIPLHTDGTRCTLLH